MEIESELSEETISQAGQVTILMMTVLLTIRVVAIMKGSVTAAADLGSSVYFVLGAMLNT